MKLIYRQEPEFKHLVEVVEGSRSYPIGQIRRALSSAEYARAHVSNKDAVWAYYYNNGDDAELIRDFKRLLHCLDEVLSDYHEVTKRNRDLEMALDAEGLVVNEEGEVYTAEEWKGMQRKIDLEEVQENEARERV